MRGDPTYNKRIHKELNQKQPTLVCLITLRIRRKYTRRTPHKNIRHPNLLQPQPINLDLFVVLTVQNQGSEEGTGDLGEDVLWHLFPRESLPDGVADGDGGIEVSP